MSNCNYCFITTSSSVQERRCCINWCLRKMIEKTILLRGFDNSVTESNQYNFPRMTINNFYFKLKFH